MPPPRIAASPVASYRIEQSQLRAQLCVALCLSTLSLPECCHVYGRLLPWRCLAGKQNSKMAIESGVGQPPGIIVMNGGYRQNLVSRGVALSVTALVQGSTMMVASAADPAVAPARSLPPALVLLLLQYVLTCEPFGASPASRDR
jgi:hypothetical protein